MEYSHLTTTKYKILYKCSKSSESKNNDEHTMIRLNDIPEQIVIPSHDAKIYFFKCKTDYIYPQSRKLVIIYENTNGEFIKCKIYKLKKHINKNTIANLENHNKTIVRNLHKKAIEEIDWNKTTELKCIYINIIQTKLNTLDILSDMSLSERIDPDISFGFYNPKELLYLHGKKYVLSFIKPKIYYKNIDFKNIINCKTKNFNFDIGRYSNYMIDIECFNGQKYKADSFIFNQDTNLNDNKIHDNDTCGMNDNILPLDEEDWFSIDDYPTLLDIKHQIRISSKMCYKVLYGGYFGCYSGHNLSNYYVIIKNKQKLMFIFYGIENTTQDGFVFKLYSRIFKSTVALWKKLTTEEKMLLLKYNAPSFKDNMSTTKYKP
ncbi:putative orfan [Tupanvirus soda lake]|uniref:Orfan n=2 Tax=Tupanvirus TaxID=2094720 RepID=A0AC62AC90_9VIRU|nr:putative orfan [Tupanvirus soda lake]QKU35248.1 putative orfan [Tupanvirus soda lake]